MGAFEYDRLTNSLGQEVALVEHPTRGDSHVVIAMFLKEEVAFDTDFFETDDMMADHKEYEPLLIDGQIKYGFQNQES